MSRFTVDLALRDMIVSFFYRRLCEVHVRNLNFLDTGSPGSSPDVLHLPRFQGVKVSIVRWPVFGCRACR